MKKVTSLILLILVAICCTSFCKPNTETKLITVTVHAGDTLWGICDRVGNMYNPGQDVREIIYYARQQNRFDTNLLIQPGQKLIIPVEVKNND